jgi:hypothetical protein
MSEKFCLLIEVGYSASCYEEAQQRLEHQIGELDGVTSVTVYSPNWFAEEIERE